MTESECIWAGVGVTPKFLCKSKSHPLGLHQTNDMGGLEANGGEGVNSQYFVAYLLKITRQYSYRFANRNQHYLPYIDSRHGIGLY